MVDWRLCLIQQTSHTLTTFVTKLQRAGSAKGLALKDVNQLIGAYVLNLANRTHSYNFVTKLQRAGSAKGLALKDVNQLIGAYVLNLANRTHSYNLCHQTAEGWISKGACAQGCESVDWCTCAQFSKSHTILQFMSPNCRGLDQQKGLRLRM